MELQTSKIELVKRILEIENSDFIDRITSFINSEKLDFWNELSNSEKEEIQKGIDDLDNGKRIEFSEFLKKIS